VSAVIIQRARNGFIVRPFSPNTPLVGNPEDMSVFPVGGEAAIAAQLTELLSAIPSVRAEVAAIKPLLDMPVPPSV
jgi:hypothetical protein